MQLLEYFSKSDRILRNGKAPSVQSSSVECWTFGGSDPFITHLWDARNSRPFGCEAMYVFGSISDLSPMNKNGP